MRVLMLVAASLLAGCASFGAGRALQPITVRSQALPLDPGQPVRSSLGRLEYRGGLRLESEAPRFGGWSGLAISSDGGTLVAVSDEGGGWLRARLSYDRSGTLAGVRDARLGLLCDTSGRPIVAKDDSDAESLAQLPDGGWLVGFERRHRLWRYPSGRAGLGQAAREFEAPRELQQAPPNGGLEALAVLHDGRLLTVLPGWAWPSEGLDARRRPQWGWRKPTPELADQLEQPLPRRHEDGPAAPGTHFAKARCHGHRPLACLRPALPAPPSRDNRAV